LARNAAQGFPDDQDASGPTIISTATLEAICTWFPGLDLAETRRRFRANLEIAGVPAFWEDRLYGPPGQPRFFRVGAVRFEGVNPCARCAAPSLNSLTGELALANFAQSFAERRSKSLPEWAERVRFDHYYRAAVNTRIPLSESGKSIYLFDEAVLEA
jgi:uncharacterized protein YcbX